VFERMVRGTAGWYVCLDLQSRAVLQTEESMTTPNRSFSDLPITAADLSTDPLPRAETIPSA